ncbi:hypothetical protein GBAR_LOCUS30211 [Geodia barretti]|uniref:Uncharacterized protein n=1 Tax=Geodia barretti TaxID=519541 RepID=A0AA35TVN4_GEOBA|nr:hypothetical protein GBAR_LOCUS30211 [Geodia barretti]
MKPRRMRRRLPRCCAADATIWNSLRSLKCPRSARCSRGLQQPPVACWPACPARAAPVSACSKTRRRQPARRAPSLAIIRPGGCSRHGSSTMRQYELAGVEAMTRERQHAADGAGCPGPAGLLAQALCGRFRADQARAQQRRGRSHRLPLARV